MKPNSSTRTNRREFLKQTGAFSLAALGGFGLPALGAAATPRNVRSRPADGIARGTVFLDANGSGQADGQAGLPGVLVSNGVDVVSTDARGRYEIKVGDDTMLFVIKPRNYRTPVDGLNLPRFYYIHKPNGSPDADFIYPGIEPTGPLPEAIDFPLYEQEEAEDFEVLFTADPQPYNLQHLQWYGEETVREFRELDVAFGIALGDIVGDHLDLLEPYNQINALTGFPWHNVIGNHDLNFNAREDRYAEETFKRVYGPTTHAFQHASVHFLVFNNVYWEGFTRNRADGWPQRGQYRGHLRPWQLEFAKNYLKHVPADERGVVCSHIPMINRSDTSGRHGTPEFPELLKILSGHPRTLSFSGHTHINMNFLIGEEMGYRAEGGAKHHHCNLTATCGSWYRGPMDHAGVPYAPGRDGSPKGYAVVRFEGGAKYHIRVKSLGRDPAHQMNLSLPSLVEHGELAQTKLHANVYYATEETRVKMRIDQGEWIELERENTFDPAYVALRERSLAHPEAGDGQLPNPIPTNHHWTGALPANLANGWHEAEVEALSPHGEILTDRRAFVVAESASDLEPLNQGTREPRRA